MSIETTSEFFSVPRPFSKTVYPNTCTMFILWNSTKIRSLFVRLSDLSCFRQQSEIIYVKIKINLIRNNIIENLFWSSSSTSSMYVQVTWAPNLKRTIFWRELVWRHSWFNLFAFKSFRAHAQAPKNLKKERIDKK